MKTEIQAYLVQQEQSKAHADERARWLKVLGKPHKDNREVSKDDSKRLTEVYWAHTTEEQKPR